MHVTIIPGHSIDAALAQKWTELQMSNPDLGNPMFSPDFTKAVAVARRNVEVALLETADKLQAIFPFQRITPCLGEAVGGHISDFHGLICEPNFDCDLAELLKRCRLAAWDFDRVLATQSSFTPFHDEYRASSQINLAAGYDNYVIERRAAGSEQIKKCGNAFRRLELEVGPVRFVSHSRDMHMLRQVLAWKSEQYKRSG